MSRLELFYVGVNCLHIGVCISLQIRFRFAMSCIQLSLGHSVLSCLSNADMMSAQGHSLPYEETLDHQGVLDVTQLCSDLEEIMARWAPRASCEML